MGASLLADDTAITSGISTITTVVGQVWTTMTVNANHSIPYQSPK